MVVVVNGELPAIPHPGLRRQLVEADQLVAADGGIRHCVDLDVWPTILIGDLDSAPGELIDQARSRDIAVHTFPADKDATDLELALELARESGATAVTVVAAFGGRLDHELATVSLLAASRWRTMAITATDGDRYLHVVHGRRSLNLRPGTTVSLLPWHGDAGGVTTQGLQWPLDNATLRAGMTRGVSNVAVDTEQEIELDVGVLVVVVDPGQAD
jgi:thiamine pyrophosphokinase